MQPVVPNTTSVFNLGPNQLKSYAANVRALRDVLFINYEKNIVPTADRPELYSKAGTSVSVSIRFFKVDFVDPATGSMQVKVWLRMKWFDERLSW